MKCPCCDLEVVRVVDNVNTPDGDVYRKRKCKNCDAIFYTKESIIEYNNKHRFIWNTWNRSAIRRREKYEKEKPNV